MDKELERLKTAYRAASAARDTARQKLADLRERLEERQGLFEKADAREKTAVAELRRILAAFGTGQANGTHVQEIRKHHDEAAREANEAAELLAALEGERHRQEPGLSSLEQNLEDARQELLRANYQAVVADLRTHIGDRFHQAFAAKFLTGYGSKQAVVADVCPDLRVTVQGPEIEAVKIRILKELFGN